MAVFLKDFDLEYIKSEHRTESSSDKYSFRMIINLKDIESIKQNDYYYEIKIKISGEDEKYIDQILSVYKFIPEQKGYLIGITYEINRFNQNLNFLALTDEYFELIVNLGYNYNNLSFGVSISDEIISTSIDKIKERIERLEKEKEFLKMQIDFAPGGSGYLEAEENFNELRNQK